MVALLRTRLLLLLLVLTWEQVWVLVVLMLAVVLLVLLAWFSAPAPSGLALLSLPLSSQRLVLVGHQIYSACGVATVLGWPAAQKSESRASGSGASPRP
jgi:hypothetical protein